MQFCRDCKSERARGDQEPPELSLTIQLICYAQRHEYYASGLQSIFHEDLTSLSQVLDSDTHDVRIQLHKETFIEVHREASSLQRVRVSS